MIPKPYSLNTFHGKPEPKQTAFFTLIFNLTKETTAIFYKIEESLRYFEFWGQAQTVAREFSDEQLDQLEDLISDMYCGDYPTDTQINDLFAYDSDYLKEFLGWKKLSGGEYINPDDVPAHDDEANAESLDIILDLAGVDRDARRKLGSIADDVNRAQWNDAQDRSELVNYHPFSIEDFINALEAVQNDGDADDVRETVLFYISDQAVRIILSTYGFLSESGFDIDAVKNVIYE